MKLFWQYFNIVFIFYLLAFLKVSKLTKIETSSTLENLAKNGYKLATKVRAFSPQEKTEFDKIQKPNAPDKMPDDVLFLQKELKKSYKKAYSIANPRFKESEALNNRYKNLFPEDKRKVGVPVNRQG